MGAWPGIESAVDQRPVRARSVRLAALAVLAVLWLHPTSGFGWTLCPFRILSGTDGPFCGLTRSASALLRFEPAASLQIHVLGWLVIGFLVAAALSPGSIARLIDGPCYTGLRKSLVLLFGLAWCLKVLL